MLFSYTYVQGSAVHVWYVHVQAGATAVVPETLEPSLQLASAVLSQLNMPQDEVAHAISAFRRNHVSELQVQWPMRSPCCTHSCLFDISSSTPQYCIPGNTRHGREIVCMLLHKLIL